MKCKCCKNDCIKKGHYKNVQRFLCKACLRYQQQSYSYKICTSEDEEMIVKLNNEGVGISGIARLTGISKSHVVNKIKELASKIIKEEIKEEGQEYEVDEMYTFIKRKENFCYIIYALNKVTKRVIDFVVGRRTKENIKKVIDSVKKLNPKRIFTDRLPVYSKLIENDKHITTSYKINHIERMNLTLRTHLKRLTRKTICYSKSEEMLINCVKLYLLKG